MSLCNFELSKSTMELYEINKCAPNKTSPENKPKNPRLKIKNANFL